MAFSSFFSSSSETPIAKANHWLSFEKVGRLAYMSVVLLFRVDGLEGEPAVAFDRGDGVGKPLSVWRQGGGSEPLPPGVVVEGKGSFLCERLGGEAKPEDECERGACA